MGRHIWCSLNTEISFLLERNACLLLKSFQRLALGFCESGTLASSKVLPDAEPQCLLLRLIRSGSLFCSKRKTAEPIPGGLRWSRQPSLTPPFSWGLPTLGHRGDQRSNRLRRARLLWRPKVRMGLGLGLGLELELGLELGLELELELGRAGARAGAGAGAVGRGRCDSRLRGCDAGRRVRAGRRRPGLGECVSGRPGGGARNSCPAPPTARARSPPGRCHRGRHLAGEARAARCEGWTGRPPAPRLLFVQARRPEDQPRPRLSRERLGVARAAPVPGCAPALERGRRPGRCLRRGFHSWIVY